MPRSFSEGSALSSPWVHRDSGFSESSIFGFSRVPKIKIETIDQEGMLEGYPGSLGSGVEEILGGEGFFEHLAEALKSKRWIAQRMAYCLHKMGAARQVGKEGNAWLYEATAARKRRRRAA